MRKRTEYLMGTDGPGPSWPSAVVALGLIALVGVMFWRAVDSASFVTIWAGAGTLVGVLIGAVPSYFFGQATSRRVSEAEAKAEEAQTRTEAVLAVAPKEAVEEAKRVAPSAFEPWG